MVEDLRMIYDMSRSEVYSTIWRTVDAINKALKPPPFPLHDPVKLDALERDFRGKSRLESWEGQVGAVDGCHFATFSPGVAVKDPSLYYVHRKSKYAILCTAVCDAYRRFTFWDMNVGPQSHDSQAWGLTSLGMDIAAGKLPDQYFINGDSAYVSSPQMVVPYNKTAETHFDFLQSSNRMCIECAFGMLIRRWGVLWRPIQVDFPRRTKLISCCMVLHNYCITERICDSGLATMDGSSAMAVPSDGGCEERWEPTPTFRDGRPVAQLNWINGSLSAGPESTRRTFLASKVLEAGFRRPDPALTAGRR